MKAKNKIKEKLLWPMEEAGRGQLLLYTLPVLCLISLYIFPLLFLHTFGLVTSYSQGRRRLGGRGGGGSSSGRELGE